jgi:hypothetical protein
MRLTVFAATLAFLLWGTPAFAESSDYNGVGDQIDNCSEAFNPAQDDTDADGCGNICDADYDNSGIVGFGDFGEFIGAFGTTELEMQHVEPITADTTAVGWGDFGEFIRMFGDAPGPSGTTAGTMACPLESPTSGSTESRVNRPTIPSPDTPLSTE